MKLHLITSFFLLCAWSSAGQSKIKFGKVDPVDLAMTVFPADTEAHAVILSDMASIRFDPMVVGPAMIRFHHVAIKILTPRGAEQYGDITIPYYSHDRASYITNLRAMIHLPDGTEIKLRNENFFDEVVNDFWSRKKIAFPAVQPGAIIEYEYQLNSADFFHPVDWFFQGPSPIRFSELQVRIPNWFDYVVLTQGQRLMENRQVQETEGGGDIVYNKWIYSHRDMPALKEEKHITTMEDYYARVRFRLNYVHFPNQIRENVLNDWASVAEALWSNPSFGYQLNNKRPGELVLEAAGVMPTDTGSQFSRAHKVYVYINANISNNGLNSIGVSTDIADILKRRSGDSGQLNKLMLAALLQMGVDAKPVLISTRSHGKVFEPYPFLDQFDHLLVMAVLDGKTIWIDVGNALRPMGQIAGQSLNSRGWVATRKDPFWTTLPEVESKTVVYIRGRLHPDGMVSGECEARFTGFHALEQRMQFHQDKENYFHEQLMTGTITIPLQSIEAENVQDVYKPFQIKGSFRDLPSGEVGGDRIYVAPIVMKSLLENPFRRETRSYPVEYQYPEEYNVIFELALPEGYTTETLPKPAKYTNEENSILTSLQSSAAHGKANTIFKFQVRTLEHDPSEYLGLKNIYNLRKELLSEPIVIRKAP